jgi:hypothetical protein
MEPNDEEEVEPVTDSKGNVLAYEASPYARPRTKGRMKNVGELDDRSAGTS